MPSAGQVYEWTTAAGPTSGPGLRDGPSDYAAIGRAEAVAVDATGRIFLADTDNHAIRLIDGGTVSTIAGKGGVAGSSDGVGTDARFNKPAGIVIASDGSLLIADTGNHSLRRIGPSGTVTTIAGQPGTAGHFDGPAATALFSTPRGLAIQPDGAILIADRENHVIRRVAPDGTVSTVAGTAGVTGSTDGPSADSRFNKPGDLTVSTDGIIYVVENGNRTVRRITPDGEVSTLAGLAGASGSTDGIGTAARFLFPRGITISDSGDLYVADYGALIRKIDTTTGQTTTLDDGDHLRQPLNDSGTLPPFFTPAGIASCPDGSTVVVEPLGRAIYKVTAAGAISTLITGGLAQSGDADGASHEARFREPSDLVFGPDDRLYVADTANHTIRVMAADGSVSTFAGSAGVEGTSDGGLSTVLFRSPHSLVFGPDGSLYVGDRNGESQTNRPHDRIRRISFSGSVTTLAGSAGSQPSPHELRISGLAATPDGGLFSAGWSSIRRISAAGSVSYFAGQIPKRIVYPNGVILTYVKGGSPDGVGLEAGFSSPSGLTSDAAGNLYVTEYHGAIRKVTPQAAVTTIAGISDTDSESPSYNDGTGLASRFLNPTAIAADAAGNLFVADTGNHLIRKISPAGVVTTIGGIPEFAGAAEGSGDAALFNGPSGITVDAAGQVWVADTGNHRIVKGVPLPRPEIVVEHPVDGSHLSSGDQVALGSIRPGSTGSQSLTIRNAGHSPLEVEAVSLDGADAAEFAVAHPPLPITIPAGSSSSVDVFFTPTVHGWREASLRITSNDLDEPEIGISLSGAGNRAPEFPGYKVSLPSASNSSVAIRKVLTAATDPDGDPLTISSVSAVEGSGADLRIIGDNLRYIQDEPPLASDGYVLTISDPYGGTATGLFAIILTNDSGGDSPSVSNNPPMIRPLPDNAGLEVGFFGIPGWVYQVQRSADLETWETIGTPTTGPDGRLRITDPDPPSPTAYYRIAAP